MQEQNIRKRIEYLSRHHELIATQMKEIDKEIKSIITLAPKSFTETILVLGSLNGIMQTRFEDNFNLLKHIDNTPPHEFETMTTEQQYAWFTAQYKKQSRSFPPLSLQRVFEEKIKKDNKNN